MGKMGKQDGRPGKSLGNPLNILKNFRVGGGGKIRARLSNLKLTFFILGLRQYKTSILFSQHIY